MKRSRANLQRHKSPHERRVEGPDIEHLRGNNQQTVEPKPFCSARLAAKDRVQTKS
jgi:hypothetical protein